MPNPSVDAHLFCWAESFGTTPGILLNLPTPRRTGVAVKPFPLFLLTLCCALLLPTSRSSAQTATPDPAPGSAATAWLALADGGKYVESWQATASELQKAVKQERWAKVVENLRTAPGKLESRKVKGAQAVRNLPGAPAGEYYVIQYDSDFEHKKGALETLTLMKDADGAWKAVAYFIK